VLKLVPTVMLEPSATRLLCAILLHMIRSEIHLTVEDKRLRLAQVFFTPLRHLRIANPVAKGTCTALGQEIEDG
jgi:hypothetical protein